MATVFYRFRKSVARIVRDDAGVSVAIYDRANDRWVDFPPVYGKLTGLGGDPPVDEIPRDEVLRIIDSDPDGPAVKNDADASR
jgi:hypothetical protein